MLKSGKKKWKQFIGIKKGLHPKNFNSVKAMHALVQKLKDEN